MTADTILPRRLIEGDRVALLSPAYLPYSDDERSGLAAGVNLLAAWGLNVDVLDDPPHADRASQGAPRDVRAQRLNQAFAGDYAAVMCTRGGFGSARIIDSIDPTPLIARRAAFVGFSDVTTIHTRLNAAGMVTFYGPPLAWARRNLPEDADGPTGSPAAESLYAALFHGPQDISTREVDEKSMDPNVEDAGSQGDRHRVIGASLSRNGTVQGRLLGGNLMTLAAGIGTPWGNFDAKGAVVFLEEVDEPLPTIDRMLTQLARSGSLDGAVGFAVGHLNVSNHQRIEELLATRLDEFGVPYLGGIPAGHGRHQLTIALGAITELDTSAKVLRVVS